MGRHDLACAMQMLLVVMCRLSSRASPRTSRNVIVGPFRHQIRADACIPAIPVCFTESSNYMISTIVSALLPTVVTLLLGFFAGWHHDFDAKQATVLNSMVMLYPLPLSLFAGMWECRAIRFSLRVLWLLRSFWAWPAATQLSSAWAASSG